MLTRKTQYAWMALGGMICLFGLVLACKLRDGNKAIAQDEKLAPPPPMLVEPPSPPSNKIKEPALMPDIDPSPLEARPPFAKKASKKDTSPFVGKSEPKGLLEMPPSAPPATPMPSLATDSSKPLPMIEKEPTPPLPLPPSGVMPASFGPNTPSTKSEKKEDKKVSLPENKKSSLPPVSVGAKEPPSWDKPSDPLLPPPLAAPAPIVGKTDKKAVDSKPTVSVPPPTAQPLADKKPLPPDLPSPGTYPPLPPASPAPMGGLKIAPASFAPVSAAPASISHEADHETKAQPGEPPLAPAPGPVQTYHTHGSETLKDIARRTLGNSERVSELHKLNPTLKVDAPLNAGTTVRLPGDACVQTDDGEPVKPLPALRAKPTPPKTRVLPLTGTYQCTVDEKGQLTLPRALRDQFGGSDTVLLSPGPDKCLWLTNQAHLERLGERLEQSHANEADVRVFKRLYFAQTEKLPVNGDGRVIVPERLAQFAGLHQEVVLVGIDDHFEVWDAARWRQYTQQKSAGVRTSFASED